MRILWLFLLLHAFGVLADPVNINKADAETIAKALKGIGPKKAEAIIQYRKEHGDFKTLQDFENVKGIGDKIASANVQDILYTDAAPAAPASKKSR
jgi:competence protein ComEA